MTTCRIRGIIAACACTFLLLYSTDDAQAEEEASTTGQEVVTSKNWKEYRDALEKTYIQFGYSYTTWNYLGCDAEYHYAVDRASTILRLKKEEAPTDELFKAVQKQCDRRLDHLALGDLDLPFRSWSYSDAFLEWREKSHLDTSLIDQAEKIYRKIHPNKIPEWVKGDIVQSQKDKDSERAAEASGNCRQRFFKRAHHRLRRFGGQWRARVCP
jgi:hypothetical protein